MKRYIPWLLVALLLLTLAACDNAAPETETTATPEVTTVAPETEAPTEAPETEAPTEAPETEAPTEEDITLPPETEGDGEAWTEDPDAPYEPLVNPVVSNGKGTELHGYNASGEFSFEEGDALSTEENNMFIVTNDRMTVGKLTATFAAPEQYINDNGIIFGMVEDTEKQYYFWEDGPTYYFLFVSDDATLYLAKVSDNGAPWTELYVSGAIPNYAHGDVVTISVEFDGEGFIDCYVNDEWMFCYFDETWTGGGLYGIRCEVPGVCYTNVVADPTWRPEE